MNAINIISIACFAFCLIIFFYLKWEIKKRTTASGLKEHHIEIAKLIAEINAVTDRDLQLIEDRVIKLKSLLETVDKRITLYDKDIEELKQSKTGSSIKVDSLYTNLGRGIRSALKTQAGEASVNAPPSRTLPLQTEHPLESRELSLALHSSINAQDESSSKDAALTAKKAQDGSRSHVLAVSNPVQMPPSKKQIRVLIDNMLGEGRSPEEIASHLQISAAEVNLAMKLRRKK